MYAKENIKKLAKVNELTPEIHKAFIAYDQIALSDVQATLAKTAMEMRTQERLKQIEQELAQKKEQAAALKLRWQNEKGSIGKIHELKEQLDKEPGKYQLKKMEVGSIDDFHGGLTDRIGECQYSLLCRSLCNSAACFTGSRTTLTHCAWGSACL